MGTYLSLVAQVVPVLLLALIVDERLIGHYLDERDRKQLALDRRRLKNTIGQAVGLEFAAIGYTFVVGALGEEGLPGLIVVVVWGIAIVGTWIIAKLLWALGYSLVTAVDAAVPASHRAASREGQEATARPPVTARLALLSVAAAALLGRRRR